MKKNDIVRGYVYGRDGMHSGAVDMKASEIPYFLMAPENRFATKIVITDIFDITEVETSMGFIMYCQDQKYLQQELLPVLVPLQRGEVEPRPYQSLN